MTKEYRITNFARTHARLSEENEKKMDAIRKGAVEKRVGSKLLFYASLF